jgi:hypothetical protein
MKDESDAQTLDGVQETSRNLIKQSDKLVIISWESVMKWHLWNWTEILGIFLKVRPSDV